MPQTFYKVLNDNKHAYPYVEGLNILKEAFDPNPNKFCGKGGFYFTTIEHILRYIDWGEYIIEIFLPEDNPLFKMLKDPNSDKYRSNMIIMGRKFSLDSVYTYKHLYKQGANIHADLGFVLRYNVRLNNQNIVRFLMKKGINIHAYNDEAIDWARENNREMFKILMET